MGCVHFVVKDIYIWSSNPCTVKHYTHLDLQYARHCPDIYFSWPANQPSLPPPISLVKSFLGPQWHWTQYDAGQRKNFVVTRVMHSKYKKKNKMRLSNMADLDRLRLCFLSRERDRLLWELRELSPWRDFWEVRLLRKEKKERKKKNNQYDQYISCLLVCICKRKTEQQ